MAAKTGDTNAHADLLAILAADRTQAIALFKRLSPEEQVALVRKTPVHRWHDVLTLADDCTPLVRALSVPELHRLVSLEDLWHARELMATASPEQVRGVMDFSCWRGDDLEEQESLTWLEWLAELADDAFAERMATLDAAFLASVLGPHMRPEPEEPGEFLVYSTWVDSLPRAFAYDDQLVEQLVYRLYHVDVALYDEVINRIFRDEWTHERATHGGLADQMAEATERRARRLRKLRVRDTYESRIDLLRPLEVRPAPRGRRFATSLPEVVVNTSLLERVLARTDDPDRLRRRQEVLAKLAGEVLMARGGDPGNTNELQEAADVLKSAVSLALDALSGGSLAMAEAFAEAWRWSDLFRVGHTLLEHLRARVAAHDPEKVLCGRESLWLAGLLEVPMRVYDPFTGGYRLPDRLADLVRAVEALDRMERQRRKPGRANRRRRNRPRKRSV